MKGKYCLVELEVEAGAGKESEREVAKRLLLTAVTWNLLSQLYLLPLQQSSMGCQGQESPGWVTLVDGWGPIMDFGKS